jgi:hypothetical protein
MRVYTIRSKMESTRRIVPSHLSKIKSLPFISTHDVIVAIDNQPTGRVSCICLLQQPQEHEVLIIVIRQWCLGIWLSISRDGGQEEPDLP